MPALDRSNALTARYFHHADDCAQVVTVKYGLRSYGNLTERDGDPTYGRWHVGTAEECPDGTLAASLAADLVKRGIVA